MGLEFTADSAEAVKQCVATLKAHAEKLKSKVCYCGYAELEPVSSADEALPSGGGRPQVIRRDDPHASKWDRNQWNRFFKALNDAIAAAAGGDSRISLGECDPPVVACEESQVSVPCTIPASRTWPAGGEGGGFEAGSATVSVSFTLRGRVKLFMRAWVLIGVWLLSFLFAFGLVAITVHPLLGSSLRPGRRVVGGMRRRSMYDEGTAALVWWLEESDIYQELYATLAKAHGKPGSWFEDSLALEPPRLAPTSRSVEPSWPRSYEAPALAESSFHVPCCVECRGSCRPPEFGR